MTTTAALFLKAGKELSNGFRAKGSDASHEQEPDSLFTVEDFTKMFTLSPVACAYVYVLIEDNETDRVIFLFTLYHLSFARDEEKTVQISNANEAVIFDTLKQKVILHLQKIVEKFVSNLVKSQSAKFRTPS